MLNVIRVQTLEEKRALFQGLDPAADAWVVSDLQSKWHLQKELLERAGVLEQSTVLRATELWRQLNFQIAPETHPLSLELARTLFWDWIRPMELPWASSSRAVPVVLNQMQMWMTIFSNPDHPGIMSEWFAENQESYVRWGHWFELCATLWERCRERHLAMTSWLPALLMNHDLSGLRLKRNLIFDLGPQVSQVEGQLIRELSNHVDITVLYPEAPWLGLMPNTLRPYEILLGENEKRDVDWRPEVDTHVEFGRYSTQLAEVKDAVARVREWCEQGVAPERIAVVAPDIEEYWPALRLYLREEGIPASKALAVKLGGFLEMAQWMATLRTQVRRVSSQDLEVHLFTERGEPSISFDEFKVLFTNVYDARDLSRARQLFESGEWPEGSVDLASFLAWALRAWNADFENQRLLALLQVLGEEVPRALELEVRQWLEYLEGVLARRELTLTPGDERGIWCVPLSSADWLPTTHAVFLNLHEGGLRSSEPSPVSANEAAKIFADTGFAIGTTDRQEREFEFLWFLRRPWSELRLGFSGTDFQGQVLTPSRFWMWAGFVGDRLKTEAEAPGRTRWDEIQRLPLDEMGALRGASAPRMLDLQTALTRDQDISVNTWGTSEEARLSASSLESYHQCPFIFAAGRKLKLSDDPALDLDLDHRGRGSLLHAVLESLTVEPFTAQRSDSEIEAFIEEARARENIRIGDERLWPAVKAQHARLGRQFLNFESEWRERFPETRTVGREVAFECHWDVDAKAPTADVTPVRMRGRLDRIDAAGAGHYALIDYKGSATGQTNWTSWLKNGKFQMPLYALLLERGFAGMPAGRVDAANYYVVKDDDRRKGFHAKLDRSDLYDVSDKHRNLIDDIAKSELFHELSGLVSAAIGDIQAGKLNPSPVLVKICDSCAWRTLCRAPHLG